MMNKLFQIACLTLVLIAPAYAGNNYDYMCRVGHKSYPVAVNGPDDCDGASCTITWRGKTFPNVKNVEGCKAEYAGDGIDLCEQTKGVAKLTVGKDTFDCRMK